VRWRRDDRQPPDEPKDADAENWLSEFRPVRPDALTAADGDAKGRTGAVQPAARDDRWAENGDFRSADRGPLRPADRPGDSAQLPGAREERWAAQPDSTDEWWHEPRGGEYRSPDDGLTRSAARQAPRSDLERDVGPWARPPRGPVPRRDAPPGNVGRPPADDADTDRLGKRLRGAEHPSARPPLADRRPDGLADRRGDRRGYDGSQLDRVERTQGPDEAGRRFDGHPERPGSDQRRPGREPSGYQPRNGYAPDRPGLPPSRGGGQRGAPGDAARGQFPPERSGRPERPDQGVWPDSGSLSAGRPRSAVGGRPGPRVPPSLPLEPGGPLPGAAGRTDRRRAQPDLGTRSERLQSPDGSVSQPDTARSLQSPEAVRSAPLPEAARWAPRPEAVRPAPLPEAARPALRPEARRPARPPEAAQPVVLPEPERSELPLEAAARSALSAADSARPAPPTAAPPAPVAPGRQRPDRSLAAKLSVADLARVRQALALLAEDPVAGPGPAAASPNGSVPPSSVTGQQAPPGAVDSDDDADTFPLPVVLPGPTPPRADAAEALRGPFEPARPGQQEALAEKEPEPPGEPAAPVETLPPAAAAKLDQIKDLLLTAEALGEQNLDRHFERVSQRQRELIREFFDRAAPDRDAPG
jgi:hypothetical protein